MTRRYNQDFTHSINFGDLGDTEVEAEWTVDDAGIVYFEGCKLGGFHVTEAIAQEIMGVSEFRRQVGIVQEWWVEEGWKEHDDDGNPDQGWYDLRNGEAA